MVIFTDRKGHKFFTLRNKQNKEITHMHWTLKNGLPLSRSGQDICGLVCFVILQSMFPLRVFHFKTHSDHYLIEISIEPSSCSLERQARVNDDFITLKLSAKSCHRNLLSIRHSPQRAPHEIRLILYGNSLLTSNSYSFVSIRKQLPCLLLPSSFTHSGD